MYNNIHSYLLHEKNDMSSRKKIIIANYYEM